MTMAIPSAFTEQPTANPNKALRQPQENSRHWSSLTRYGPPQPDLSRFFASFILSGVNRWLTMALSVHGWDARRRWENSSCSNQLLLRG